MTNKFFINGSLCCAVLLARPLFLGVLVLAPAGSGFAKVSEEPRSFSLQDKSQEQAERKILPKFDTERLLAEDQARGKVSQGYRGLPQSGSLGTNEGRCETAAVCYTGNGWDLEKGAVGLLLFIDSTGTPTDYCTGTLLNNTAHDFSKHYFLTAYHCMVNPTDYAAKSVVYWNYQEPSVRPGLCVPPHTVTNGSVLDPPHPFPGSPTPEWTPKTTGFTVKANNTNTTTDFQLLELTGTVPPLCDASHPPPNCVHYAGWDATGATPTTGNPTVVGIHHPQGDAKAISAANMVPNDGTHWTVTWGDGTTEKGSSGSCLFDVHYHCIGQVHTGDNSCPGGTTTYGMLSASWNSIYQNYNTCLHSWLVSPQTYCNQPTVGTSLDGDPHIITADGTPYDFQGAGEYVALRDGGLEIQTRQSAVATAPPAADDHDGLATCVSLNTAVAARVGKHRVTYEPKLSGEPDRRGFQPNVGGRPDPSDLQLRVDGGDPITLGPAGLDLAGGGRIAKTLAQNGIEGIEIDFRDASALIVTPGGPFYGMRYLNVHFVRPPIMEEGNPPAIAGIAGAVQDKWLPALPDGKSLGPRPDSADLRYIHLYQKFGEAWRVKDKASSLFDYAEGESPETFWNPKWPPKDPPCNLPGTIPPEPASEAVAQDACRPVTLTNMHANCIFDVMATGDTGFAQTYLATQQLLPGVTATTVEDDRNPSKAGQSVTFTATVAPTVSKGGAVPTGTVQFILDGSNAGSPLTLDPAGRATWSTSTLKAGIFTARIYQVAVHYTPSPGSLYLASDSPNESHVVLATYPYWWLAILLLIIGVLILLLWWYLH